MLNKHSPTILFGAGMVGFGATVVMSSRATLKVEAILEAARTDLANIEALVNDPEISEKYDYSPTDATKDRIIVHTTRVKALVKLYAPSVAVGAVTVLCLTRSHAILMQRNMALTAAYASFDKMFKAYRKRVSDLVGVEKERDLLYDAKPVMEEIVDPQTGEADLLPTNFKMVGDRAYSPYARFFDEFSPEWERRPDYNHIFLNAQQNYFNDVLRTRGHVFLNEVYDALGIPRTPQGSVVGWLKNAPDGDGYIDFGIYDNDNPRARDFVNGREGSILLDFNVDGLIYDKI
jgi:hypothetical protein